MVHLLLVVHWTQVSISIIFMVLSILRHDLDLSGSDDVIGHGTILSQVVISYRSYIGTKSVSPTNVEIMSPKYIGERMTLTFLGHVTSSVT